MLYTSWSTSAPRPSSIAVARVGRQTYVLLEMRVGSSVSYDPNGVTLSLCSQAAFLYREQQLRYSLNLVFIQGPTMKDLRLLRKQLPDTHLLTLRNAFPPKPFLSKANLVPVMLARRSVRAMSSKTLQSKMEIINKWDKCVIFPTLPR